MSNDENSYAGKVISTSKNGKHAQIVLYGMTAQGKRISETHHCRVEGNSTFSFPYGEKSELGDFKSWNVVKLRTSERSETAPVAVAV